MGLKVKGVASGCTFATPALLVRRVSAHLSNRTQENDGRGHVLAFGCSYLHLEYSRLHARQLR